MSRIIAVVLSLFTFYLGTSQINQYGIPLIKNYPPEITKGSEQNWAVVQDHRGIIYTGNDEEGILEFDGHEWRTIPIPNKSIVRSLAVGEDGTVYAGAVADFGHLKPDATGNLHYESLLPRLDSSFYNFADVWKTYFHNGKAYFCSTNYFFIYDPDSREIEVVDPHKHTLFGFIQPDQFYAGSYTEGLMVVEDDTTRVVPGGEYYKLKNIFALVRFDDTRLLIGTPEGGFSLYNTETGEVDSTFASGRANRFARQNLISHLLALPDSSFLISTQNGGLATMDREGELEEIITKSDGIQDRTVYYSYMNPGGSYNDPVWTALSIGISRVNLNSPFRIFRENSGFLGLINTIERLDDELYIGTKTGLYKLTFPSGKAEFQQVGNSKRTVWDLQKFNLGTHGEVLLTAFEEGIALLHPNGKIEFIDQKVRDKKQYQDSKYKSYIIYRNRFEPSRVYLGLRNNIAYLQYRDGTWTEEYMLENLRSEVRSITMDNSGNLWFGTKIEGIGYTNPEDTTSSVQFLAEEDGLPSNDGNYVTTISGQLCIATKNGLYRFNPDSEELVPDSAFNRALPEGRNAIFRIEEDEKEGEYWVSFENSEHGWLIAKMKQVGDGFEAIYQPFLSLPDFSADALLNIPGKGVWFSNSNVLYHFDDTYPLELDTTFRALVRRVTLAGDSVIFNGTFNRGSAEEGFHISLDQNNSRLPEIRHKLNNIEIRWSCPYFDQEEELEYSFILEGFSKGWSDWAKLYYKDFTNLPHGTYTFKVRSRNIYGVISKTGSYTFTVLRPWHLSFVAFVVYLILAIIVIYGIIAWYTRRLKNENIRLEGIIELRTAEIRKQKEELTDSIEYASRIQRALLPPDRMLLRNNLEHFILFKPRDIVSGDFYWFGEKDGKLFIVAADCTGHGVPGAFMSMLGISFLDEIIIKSGVYETNKVLDALRDHVISSLRQTGKSTEESTKDGMDLSMVAIDQQHQTIQFSGAYNPLYYVRKLNDNEKKQLQQGKSLDLPRGALYNDEYILFQIKGDQMPIGISEKNFEFTASTMQYDEVTIYMFSDGYVDQFGGPNSKKFMSRNFKKLLLDVQHLPMKEQRIKLDLTLVEWMGNISQIDDILVIGVRLNHSSG